MNYDSLIIDNQNYVKSDLLALSADKLNKIETPGWERNLYRFIQDWLSSNPDITVTSSGTTGIAKTLKVSKQAMIASALMTGHYFQLKPEQNALLCLPTTYIAGQMMVVRAFVLGLNLIPVAPQKISWSDLGTQQIDFAAMLPQQVHDLVIAQADAIQPDLIRNLLIGGGRVSDALLAALQKLQTQLFQSYATTETLSHIAIRRLHSEMESCYRVLPEINISQDERGCLVIDAPQLSPNQVVTNDLVRLHSPTQFGLLGRIDNVINSGGIKFSPEQLETKIEKLIPQRRFFIAAMQDARLGEKVVLFIEGESWPPTKQQALKQRLAYLFPPYQRPKAIHFIEQFEKTASGKIQRQATVAKYARVLA